MMVEMDMLCGENTVVMIMLDIQNFVDQLPCMMIINQRYRAGNFLVFRPFLFNQFFANHIADCFRAVCVFMLFDVTVKFNQ